MCECSVLPCARRSLPMPTVGETLHQVPGTKHCNLFPPPSHCFINGEIKARWGWVAS